MDTSDDLLQRDETFRATTRYLEALTVLDDESVRRPSRLPGWSRAHVVAHLSRNADAFERVLAALSAGAPGVMYASAEARDQDVEDTAARLDAAGLVADARESSARLRATWEGCQVDPAATYSRVPGGDQRFPASNVGPARRAEVEIHHVDLGLGYSPGDWPLDFSLRMLGLRQDEMAQQPGGCPSMVLSATDAEGRWSFGPGDGPEISGAAGALALWLVGRGDGEGLTSSTDRLPTLGRWR